MADIALIRVSYEICDNPNLYIRSLRSKVRCSYLLTLIHVCYRSTHRLVFLLEWVL